MSKMCIRGPLSLIASLLLVILPASLLLEGCSCQSSDGSTTLPPVVANFSGTPTIGIAPLNVTFTNASTGTDTTTTYLWEFGDGSTSTEKDPPPHVYNAIQSYNVKLTVTGPAGTSVEDRPGYVAVVAPVAADFTATPLSGPVPLDVTFADTSSGADPATTYLWDFGDGTAGSTERNPVHQYDHTGLYNVRLTVTGLFNSDVRTQDGLISAILPLGDPSFENQEIGETPDLPWLGFFGPNNNFGHTIYSVAGGSDLGMPTDGQLWCELGADSTGLPAPLQSGDGVPTNGSAGISQSFTFPVGRPVLQLNTVFINAEGLNQAARNDWLSIDVTDGFSTLTIHRRDTFSAFEGTSGIHSGQIATANEVVTANLEDLLKADPKTLLTVTMQVANDGDSSNPSHGYFDNLRFEPVAPALDVQFSADQVSVQLGTPIQFTDQTVSTGPGASGPTSWVWDFGDDSGDSASSLQNPVHTYAQAGLYDVTLRATAPGVSNELQKIGYITVILRGSVDFSVRTRRAETYQVLLFTNLSNGLFADWTWEFGDGQTEVQTVQATPVYHAYASPGLYSVTLTGRRPDQSTVIELKTDYILVQDPPVITSQPQDVELHGVGQQASFDVVATGTDLHYQWRRNGVVIAGGPDSPHYTTPPTTLLNNNDAYRCRVFNVVGTVLSDVAFLHVFP